ncbi:MAG TPA: hypothetical protein VL995_21155 [Cellvibrio sp.]|nr:hypothetical protein [Cellvibrio sp.]
MLLKKLTPWIIGCVVGCVVFCAACFVSYREGVAATEKKYLGDEIKALNESIGKLDVATKDAAKANLLLHETISKRKKADAESTKVFANALASTTHLRFNCMFDDSIMQQLNQAANAADAAAASGFNYALPTSDSPR